MNVRTLGVDDLEALHALDVRSQPLPWSDDQLLLELVNDDARVLGAVIPEELVAFAVFRRMVDELWVLNIAVDPGHRRHGYARALLGVGIEHARALSMTSVWLEVREGNVGARALYRAMGFEERGVRPRYYPPIPPATAHEAAVLMALTL